MMGKYDFDILEYSRNGEEAPQESVEPEAVPGSDDLGWDEVITRAMKNTPASAVQFGADMIRPFVNPKRDRGGRRRYRR
jgi:hypothetical protein